MGKGGPRTDTREYVLGTGRDELVRLEIQHRLWAGMASESWRRAGIGPGSRVLDLGSGPGHATFDLAQLVTPAGVVVAADQSAAFIEYIRNSAPTRAVGGGGQVKAVVSDALVLAPDVVKEAPYDAVFMRWLLCFIPEPERVLAAAGGVLRPGGRVVIHDYFNWGAMTAAPRSAVIDRLVSASVESWRERGGDPDVVAKLPGLLEAGGFRLLHMDMHARIARGGRSRGKTPSDPLMAWLSTWWRTYAPKLVSMGKLTRGECDAGLAEMEEIERDPLRFYVCPAVYEIIAETRG